jgi:hypothetical protein
MNIDFPLAIPALKEVSTAFPSMSPEEILPAFQLNFSTALTVRVFEATIRLLPPFFIAKL